MSQSGSSEDRQQVVLPETRRDFPYGVGEVVRIQPGITRTPVLDFMQGKIRKVEARCLEEVTELHRSFNPDQRDPERYARDLEAEARLHVACLKAAALLIDCAGALGWGGGHEEAYGNATAWVYRVARHCGIPTDPYDRVFAEEQDRKRRQIPREVVRSVWNRDGWECVHCGSHRDLTVDHVVPVSRGGSDSIENLQTMCGPCNMSKGNRESVGPSRPGRAS